MFNTYCLLACVVCVWLLTAIFAWVGFWFLQYSVLSLLCASWYCTAGATYLRTTVQQTHNRYMEGYVVPGSGVATLRTIVFPTAKKKKNFPLCGLSAAFLFLITNFF